MSWRNFLTPYGEKYLIQKDEDQSVSRISQNSYSPIQGMNINKSKSSLDISQTTFMQHDISKLLNNNLPNHYNNHSNNPSARQINIHNKSDLDDNTYNISITQDPFASSSNTSCNNQPVQQKPKYENKLEKIKDEMSKLKIELSKFPKKNNGRKNSQQNTQNTLTTEGNQKRVSNENINPINISHRQSLQNIKNDHFINQQQLQQINRHRNSLHQIKSSQDLSITKKDELSFSQNRQILDHDSFITEDDIQQISDSLQHHLSNYNKVSDRLNAVHLLNNGQLAQIPQHAISQLTTAHLTGLAPSQQNTLTKQQLPNTTIKLFTDKEIQTASFREQDNAVSAQKQQQSQQERHQKSTEHQKTPQIKHQMNNHKYYKKIANLRQDRNQLLEALENVLSVISKDKSKNSDSKQISLLKEELKQMKKVKKSFKNDLNSLRQEFLDIGHIEPLNLSCKKELDNLINYSSIQSYQTKASSIKNSPNSSNLKHSSTMTTTVPQYYFMPLQQNKISSSNNSTNNSNNKPTPLATLTTNLLQTDEVSFRNNILANKSNNTSFNYTNSNNKQNNMSNLLQTEDVSFRQNIPVPLHLSQNSIEFKQKLSATTSPQLSSQKTPTSFTPNIRSNFTQFSQTTENKASLKQTSSSSLSLMEQYKKQQIDKTKPSENPQSYSNTSPLAKQSKTPTKLNGKYEDSYQAENMFNARISPNQLFKTKQSHVSPHNEYNQSILESNYQTFSQQEHLQQDQEYYNY